MDNFVSFWVGACCGLVFGIIISAVFAAISNQIEGNREE